MGGTLYRNARYGIRVLARSPVFTLIVVLTLGIGIGANGAVFSVVDNVLLQPLPFPDADRLVRLGEIRVGAGVTSIAPVRLQDWTRMSSTFEAISGYFTSDAIDTTGDLPERLRQATVAPRFLDVWGVPPALGRGFADEEHRFGNTNVVLLSDRLWRARGADPTVPGRTIRSAGATVSIAGIMPSFQFPDRNVDVWAPFPVDAPFTQAREPAWLTGIGRLKAGVTLAEARADLAAVQSRLAEQYGGIDGEIGVHVESLKENIVGSARGSLWLLFGAVSVLLFVSCTNIAALLLSRATRREHEIAVRYSLGASRAAVVAQLLTEAAILGFAGALASLPVVVLASKAFFFLAPDLPRVDEIEIDARLLLYLTVSAIVVASLCGLVPAVRSARGTDSIGSSARAPVSPRHSLQWSLVGVQVALSVTLLAGAGLLLRSAEALSRVNAGFDPTRVLTFGVTGRFGEPGGYDGLVQRVNRTLDELEGLPGIESATTASALPGVPGQKQEEFELAEGRAAAEPALIAVSRIVSPSYFETLRIPLLGGELCIRPTSAQGRREIMVNRSFAERYFPGRSVIGLNLEGASAGRIVGIVGDARELGADREPVPTVYGCFSAPSAAPWYLVRTTLDSAAAARATREKIAEIEPLRPVYDIAPLEERIGDAYAQNRLRTSLLGFFAVAALSLSCLGVYGTLSYIVSLRSREIGLRITLGAVSSDIVVQFLTKVLWVVGIACAVGLALSFVFTRFLSGMLYGVTPSDPTTLFGVVALVVGVALVAALFPALRASRIDPMQALREE
jgi:predicted permease